MRGDPARRVARLGSLLNMLDGPAARYLLAQLPVGFVCLGSVLLLTRAVGVRGVLWFPDTPLVIGLFVAFVVGVAAAWDGLLLSLGAARRVAARMRGSGSAERGWSDPWSRRGFFSLGIWPLPLIAVTIFFLLGTSNITNVSLELLHGSTTSWHDPFFWSVEEPLFRALLGDTLHVVFWETIYNSGWQAEMTALFVICVASRTPRLPAAFCMSFVLLFYLGRLLGLATPVMGPAFFVSHHFRYLHGSVTEWMMHRVYATIVAGPDAAEQGAVLLGGVGAMPSLHVGMVALAAYWLVMAVPRALPLALLWVALVWTATLVLGWHYALDGLGGIATAAFCIFLTKRILGRAGPGARAEAPAPSPA